MLKVVDTLKVGNLLTNENSTLSERSEKVL